MTHAAYLPPASSANPLFAAASDPVGGADHSHPIRPEDGSRKPLEFWEDALRRRAPRKREPPKSKGDTGKAGDDDHQVDDYA